MQYITETFALNQYTLPGKFMAEIDRVGKMDKKDRGLGRAFKRLIEQIARPSIEPFDGNELCIDFTFELNHANFKGKIDIDWYERALIEEPALANADCLQFCMLSKARDNILGVLEWLFNKNELTSFMNFVLLRFCQVKDPNGDYRILPVISVVIPRDLEQWSAAQKLIYVGLLKYLCWAFHGEEVKNTLVSEAHTWKIEKSFEMDDVPVYKMSADITARKINLLSTYDVLNQRFEVSPYRSRPSAVYLA